MHKISETMRKYLLMMCLLLCGMSTAMAQDEYDVSDIVMGVRAGASFNHFSSAPSSNSILIGPTVGADVEIFVTKKFIVDVDMSVIKKGARKMRFDNDEVKIKDYAHGPYDYKLWYISTSYMGKYILNKNFRVYGGLTLSRLFRARTKDHTRTDRSVNIRNTLKKGGVGLTAGVEYLYKNKYYIDARYTWDINRLPRVTGAKIILDHSHNESLALTLGYRFQLF